MNRRVEDAMLRLAFGDVSPEEAAMLERESATNPEAARTLATYRQMRDGLRDLHDIPQDQLSKERLRHAILSSGLKPEPTRTQRSWLWMPAAAAVFAIGLSMVRNMPNQSGQPTILEGNGSPVATTVVPPFERATPESTEAARPSVKGPVATNDVFADPDDFVGVESTPPVSRRRASAKVRDEAASVIDTKDLVSYVLPNTSEEKVQGPDPMPSQPARFADNRSGSAEEPPIIIIESQKDGSTGAQKATEVGSATNVITSG
jgi:hypothetical protein